MSDKEISGRLFACPVDGCGWIYLEKKPPVTRETLQGVFGPGVMMAVSEAGVLADTERAIEGHLRGHSVVEWVNTVMRLKRLAGEGIMGL